MTQIIRLRDVRAAKTRAPPTLLTPFGTVAAVGVSKMSAMPTPSSGCAALAGSHSRVTSK